MALGRSDPFSELGLPAFAAIRTLDNWLSGSRGMADGSQGLNKSVPPCSPCPSQRNIALLVEACAMTQLITSAPGLSLRIALLYPLILTQTKPYG